MGQVCASRFVVNSHYNKGIAVRAGISTMQVKGSRPACVEVRDTACEFPSISFHRPAVGGLVLSHFDVIDTELQPDRHHARLSCCI